MGLKEYCDQKGIKINLPTEAKELNSLTEVKNKTYQTVGEIFDMLKAMGYEKMPVNGKINSGRWKAQ